jgi:hypothetical protein
MLFHLFSRQLFLAILGFGISFLGFAGEKVLQASEFIQSSDEDVDVGLYCLFQKAKKENYTKIVFEKGTYHVYSDRAYDKFMFISNHDSVRRKIAFPIIGFEGLEIEGGGAEFIMHGLVIPVVVEDSKGVIIRNLSFDHFRVTHSDSDFEKEKPIKSRKKIKY